MSIFTLIEGIVSIARPKKSLGYSSYDAIYPAGVNTLFDFVDMRKDILIETDKPIVVKFESTSADAINLGVGSWFWSDHYAKKAYVTFTEPTEFRLLANG